jgi:hypothetical protein
MADWWHYFSDYVRALAGGEVDLAGRSVTATHFMVDGTDSVLGVAGIT